MSNITEEAIATAAQATAEAEALAALTAPPSDYKALYDEKTAEVDRLNAIITAGRIAATTPANKSHKPVITTARLRAMVGDAAFVNMSRTERIVGLGGDVSVTDDTLRKGWGRGNDGKFAQDLHKTDPRKYGLLREMAIALNIFGN
jgi:phosphoglycerate dehydrogenase-like enzyme